MKKIANHFICVLWNVRYFFAYLIEAPHFTAGNASFCFWAVSKKDCFDIIRFLNPNKLTGHCEILVGAVFDGKRIVAAHLTFILIEFIKNCSFPAKLKRATVTPIHKKVDVEDATIYRHISVTTSFSKIFERTLNLQITTYVEYNGILTPFQFAFGSGVSSHDAFLYFVETLRQEIENGNLVQSVFLDFSKASDPLSLEIP